MPESYVIDAIRTPIGRYGGALSGVRPDDLAAHVVRQLVDRSDVDPDLIDDVFFGNANGAGEDNRDVARMAVLLAGLPTTVPGVTVNRLCGSGLEAAIERQPRDRDRRRLAGHRRRRGVDEPRALGAAQAGQGLPGRPRELYSTTLGWRMVNPRMPEQWTIALGESAEILADRYEITREQQDAFALAQPPARRRRLGRRASTTTDVVPVPGTELDARRGHPPRHVDGEAGQAPARLPQGRHGHRRQRLAAERRRRRCC